MSQHYEADEGEFDPAGNRQRSLESLICCVEEILRVSKMRNQPKDSVNMHRESINRLEAALHNTFPDRYRNP